MGATILVVMGVSGSGKSTVGQRLSEELGWQFEDGDDYHPESNRSKMATGNPLTDEDRYQWLLNLHKLIKGWHKDQQCGIVVCSALKFKYRQLLLFGPSADYFDGSPSHQDGKRSLQDVAAGCPQPIISGASLPKGCPQGSTEKCPQGSEDTSNSGTTLQQASLQETLPSPGDMQETMTSQVQSEQVMQHPKDHLQDSQVRPDTLFVHLKGSFEQISLRLTQRKGHFFNPSLLQSQFQTLEELRESERGMVVDIGEEVDHVVSRIITKVSSLIS